MPWNAGSPLPLETRLKISAALRGRKLAAEHCANISAANKGKAPPRETLEKSRQARMGKPLSAEHRAKISAAMKAKPTTPERMAALTAARKPPCPPEQHAYYRKMRGAGISRLDALAAALAAQKQSEEAASNDLLASSVSSTLRGSLSHASQHDDHEPAKP